MTIFFSKNKSFKQKLSLVLRVFHWEEKPLTATIPGNDPAIFEKIVSTIKFAK